MRLALLAAALFSCMLATRAGASCETDLEAAREVARLAGPVRVVEHFISYDGNGATGRPATIVIDLIRPDRMRRIMIFEDGQVRQMVLIAGSGWSGSIERGWEPLDTAFSTQMLTAVMQNSPWASVPAQVSCGTALDEEGKAVMTFRFSVTKDNESATNEMRVDEATRRPLRYRSTMSRNGVRYMSNDKAFHFIGSLEIEAPK